MSTRAIVAMVLSMLAAMVMVASLALGTIVYIYAGPVVAEVEVTTPTLSPVTTRPAPTTTAVPTTTTTVSTTTTRPKPTTTTQAGAELTPTAKWETREEPIPGEDSAAEVKAFIRYTDKLIYALDAYGPYAFDCNGIVNEVWNRITKSKRWSIHWEDNDPYALRKMGFRKFDSTEAHAHAHAFVVGLDVERVERHGKTVFVGHVAGNFLGLRFEARNHDEGILVGSDAMSVWDMEHLYYLPLADEKYL